MAKASGSVKATAPGKIILFGEHAVVYGRPAIAAPLSELRATAVVQPRADKGVVLSAPDLGLDRMLAEASEDDALALAVKQVQEAAGIIQLPDMLITVISDIPIASGLGSGAAITAAIIRALAIYLNKEYLVTNEWVSQLTFEIEKIYHGTPSGIDNTVVTYERPVYFVRQEPRNRIETFEIGRPLPLLIADTGVSSRTKVVVSDVRRAWHDDHDQFERLFDDCGAIAREARTAIANGDLLLIGDLMNQNHALLVDMTVSSPELNHLVKAAVQAGAFGAKLSGGGRGGNMIALVDDDTEAAVHNALLRAGAHAVLGSRIAS
ncbi:MAG: mevalonate kinase [Candidatus Promineifilaceae bacterium]|nr:mevalonate kinase [Candidatus Promineifilaceae bacterium]